MVAIKVLSLNEGEEGYEEIRGEIEMLERCSHPNVVSYQGEEYLWIVMEYRRGGSVVDLMNVTDEPLEEYQLAYICKETLRARLVRGLEREFRIPGIENSPHLELQCLVGDLRGNLNS